MSPRLGNAQIDVEISGYRSVIQDAINSRKGGRNSGGIALLYKNALHDWISNVKKSPNFLWFKISKDYTKTNKDIYTCRLYIPPHNSRYFNGELFEELEMDIALFSSHGSILLMGDFNSRTGKYSDSICQEGSNVIPNDGSELSLNPTQRNSFDNEVNNHGKRLLDICKSADLRILRATVCNFRESAVRERKFIPWTSF